MSSDYDATEFIDGDLHGRPSPPSAANQPVRAPTREEVDSQVADKQRKLAELKHAQEELERERAALEETRRRQMDFHTGRQEMIQHLTRGVGLLEESEFTARRDAEQIAKELVEMRAVLGKIQDIHEETWTQETFSVELTRALTAVENARMEWNAARLKFPVLAGSVQSEAPATANPAQLPSPVFGTYSFADLCRFGFALTWPVAVMFFLGLVVLAFLVRH